MAHPDARRVAVHVAEERLLAPVLHLDRAPRAQAEQGAVDLQRDVLAGAERAADAAEREPHALGVEGEAGGDLLAILVEPLGGDVELEAGSVVVGHGEGGLQAEEGLVLHADLVGALHDDRPRRVGVAAADALVAQHVAPRVDRRGRGVRGAERVGERRQRLVLDADRLEGAPTGLRMVGGDGGDRLPDVSHHVAREDGLVGVDEAVGGQSGHVVGGEDARHAVDRQCRRDVDGDDPRVRMGAAQRRSPEHVGRPGVGGEREAPLHLGPRVRAARRVAERPAARRGVGARRGAHVAPARRASRAARTAANTRP